MLIIVAALIAICLLVAGERLLKRQRQARQRQQMAYRLSKAAARAEVAERKRKAAVAASAELTSVMPAINQPKPTFDGVLRQAHRTRTPRQHGSPGTGPHSTGPQRLATGPQRHSTGPQRPGTGAQRQNTGPQRRPGTAAAARPRCQEQQRRLPGVQRPGDQRSGDQRSGDQRSDDQGSGAQRSGDRAPATPPGGKAQSAE